MNKRKIGQNIISVLILFFLCFQVGCTKKPSEVKIVNEVSNVTMNIGDSLDLKAEVNPKGASNSINWYSSDHDVATIDANGKVVAKGVGEATITARSNVNTNLSDTITISVNDKINIKFVDETDYLVVGRVNKKVLQAYDTNNRLIEDVNWLISDPTLATIDLNGEIIGKRSGMITITAYSSNDLLEEGTMSINIYDIATRIQIDEIKDLYEINTEINLNTKVLPETAFQDCFFQSSDDTVATINEDGIIKTIKQGTVQITIISKSKNDLKKIITLNVCNSFETEAKFETTDEYLKNLFNEALNENILLPTTYQETSANITWNSSNNEIITNDGIINMQKIVVRATLTATIKLDGETRTYEYTAVINRINSDKKLTFIYVATWGFKGFRSGDLDKLDYINISFADIAKDKDGKYIPSLDLPSSSVMTNMLKAKDSGVGVILSIGGWGSGGFSEITSDASKRSQFVQSIINTIKQYNLDGIDLDWEYPTSTSAGITASANDRSNFTSLCKELREAMDEYKIGLLLTAATVCDGRSTVNKCYDLAALNNYLDYINIMTYDMSSRRGHHTNLYPSDIPNASSSSADTAVKVYSSLGFDVSKLVIGCAFYGKVLNVTSEGQYHGLGISGTKIEYEGDADGWDYSIIKSTYINQGIVTEYFDDSAKASYLYGNNVFISCDTPTSIKAKCDYVNENNLGGIMAWEYTQDTSTSELLSAINTNINK